VIFSAYIFYITRKEVVAIFQEQEARIRMNKQEAYGQLHQAGFSRTEIYYLFHLREHYVAKQAKREEVAIFRRLEFVRWLVRTGRLIEQTVRERESAEEREDFPQSV
jgi:hypothetical protein